MYGRSLECRAALLVAACLFCGPIRPARAQQQPLTTFRYIQGQWTSIEPGIDVAFLIDDQGRVSAFAGALSGRLIVQTGPGGSNYAVSTSAGTCYYDIRFYEQNNKANWVLTSSVPIKGNELSCPEGNFARETGVGENEPIEIQDSEIRRRIIHPDYTDVSPVFHYEVFVYENPVYAYVDAGQRRKTVLYSACSSIDGTCDVGRAQERFCALQGFQGADEPGLDGVTQFVSPRDFEKHWYWDLFKGKTMRRGQNAKGLEYLSRVSCRR